MNQITAAQIIKRMINDDKEDRAIDLFQLYTEKLQIKRKDALKFATQCGFEGNLLKEIIALAPNDDQKPISIEDVIEDEQAQEELIEAVGEIIHEFQSRLMILFIPYQDRLIELGWTVSEFVSVLINNIFWGDDEEYID